MAGKLQKERHIYTYIYMFAMARLISVANDVYEELTARKGKEDSYSTVIRKALGGKKTGKDAILALFKGSPAGFDEEALKDAGKMWKKWTKEYA